MSVRVHARGEVQITIEKLTHVVADLMTEDRWVGSGTEKGGRSSRWEELKKIRLSIRKGR
jgi:hypothetical protein